MSVHQALVQTSPLQTLTPLETPPLRSVSDEPLKILAYRWIRFYNRQGKQLVIPFYVCEGIQHPNVSVTRLLAQGFSLTLTGTESAITHGQGFKAPLTKKNQLLYMQIELAPLEQRYSLDIRNTTKGQAAMIAPTQGGNNDYWKYNKQGYLVRVPKRDRKAMFTPDHGKQSTCPAPLDRLTTTEEQLSTENSRSPLYWRISTKH